MRSRPQSGPTMQAGLRQCQPCLSFRGYPYEHLSVLFIALYVASLPEKLDVFLDRIFLEPGLVHQFSDYLLPFHRQLLTQEGFNGPYHKLALMRPEQSSSEYVSHEDT